MGLDGSNLRPALADHGRGIQPSVRGHRLVFIRPVSGYATVHGAELEGDVEVLTDIAQTEQTPALSPDGGRLAFARSVGGIPKLFMAEPDGTNARRLTTNFGSGDTVEQAPSFSPDGARVVFSAATGDLPDLFIVDVDTGEVELLLAARDALIQPDWHPDGGFIVFTAGAGERADIHLLDLESGESAQLTDGPDAHADPAWLQSGEIAFTAYGGAASALRVVDPSAPIDVFFIDEPEVIAGVEDGSEPVIRILDGAGDPVPSGFFTDSDQPFFHYDQELAPNEVSSAVTWKLAFENLVTADAEAVTYRFAVLLYAAAPTHDVAVAFTTVESGILSLEIEGSKRPKGSRGIRRNKKAE